MKARSWIFYFAFLLCVSTQAESVEFEEPLWEYGVGFGYIEYEHYPASNQYSYLALPFPTFKYRGKILRADDREGTRAYLFKNQNYSFELSGTFNPPLKSEGNQTRQGMQDLPAILALGPQLVFKLPQEWNFKLGWFYALASDGRAFWFPGSVYEARLDRQWQKDLSHWRDHTKSISKFTVSFKMASKDFNALYYSVPEQDVRTDRVSYEARGGNMGLEYSFFQMLQTGLAGFYAGMSYSDYSISSNRSSPLYKTEWSLTGFFGLNYILGESQRASVPLKETQGLINQMRQRRTDPF